LSRDYFRFLETAAETLRSILSFGIAVSWPWKRGMQDPTDSNEVTESLRYVRIHSDPDGASHFSDEDMPFTLMDFAPPAPKISVSGLIGAEGVTVISSPAGWNGDWHPAPSRQLMFFLDGELEVQVSDGEIRRFGPGAIVLVEDTTGRGHVSKVVGAKRAFLATAFLTDPTNLV